MSFSFLIVIIGSIIGYSYISIIIGPVLANSSSISTIYIPIIVSSYLYFIPTCYSYNIILMCLLYIILWPLISSIVIRRIFIQRSIESYKTI